MYKPILLIWLAACTSLSAQVQLLSSDMPHFGTLLTYSWCGFAMVDTMLQGQDVTWHFTALETGGEEWTEAIVHPANTAFAADFPAANYARVVYAEGNTLTYYYDLNNAYMDLVGIWTALDWGSTAISPFLVFPMSLGTQYTPWSSPMVSTITGLGTGTLVLPAGTFSNVVMLRRLEAYPGGAIYKAYEWYSTETGALLLYRMSSNDFLIPNDAKMLVDISTAASAHIAPDDRLRCVSPATDELQVLFGSAASGIADLVITNNLGQVLHTSTIAVQRANSEARSTWAIWPVGATCSPCAPGMRMAACALRGS